MSRALITCFVGLLAACASEAPPEEPTALLDPPASCVPDTCEDLGLSCGSAPDGCAGQLDCGTCVEAGADPVAWIKANPGRIKSVHLKDWGAGDGRGYNVAFGEGDVPWKALLDAAESVGGVEYYLIEQERAGADGEIAMAKKCLENYRKLRT